MNILASDPIIISWNVIVEKMFYRLLCKIDCDFSDSCTKLLSIFGIYLTERLEFSTAS